MSKAAKLIESDNVEPGKVEVIAPKETESIQKVLKRINQHVGFFNEEKLQVVKDLCLLKERHIELLEETGKTFAEYINDVVKMSKSYFYELVENYEFIKDHGDINLFSQISGQKMRILKKIPSCPKIIEILPDVPKMSIRALNLLRVRTTDSGNKQAPSKAKRAYDQCGKWLKNIEEKYRKISNYKEYQEKIRNDINALLAKLEKEVE
jgi:hypothetical protein